MRRRKSLTRINYVFILCTVRWVKIFTIIYIEEFLVALRHTLSVFEFYYSGFCFLKCYFYIELKSTEISRKLSMHLPMHFAMCNFYVQFLLEFLLMQISIVHQYNRSEISTHSNFIANFFTIKIKIMTQQS